MELFIFLFIMMITGMLTGSILTYLALNRLFERDITMLREVIESQKPVIGNTKTERVKSTGKAEIVAHLTPEQRAKQKNKVLMDTEEEMDKLFKSVIK